MRHALLALLLLSPVLARGSALEELRRLSDVAVSEEPALGDGYVEGEVWLSCPTMGWGRADGSVRLSGRVRVRDAQGRSGEIAVSGSSFLDGRCRANEAAVSGVVPVSGKGILRGSEGSSRPVLVQGEVPVHLNSSAARVWMRVYVSVRERP